MARREQSGVWLVGALLGAAAASFASYTVSSTAATNLPGHTRSVVVVGLVAIALICGFLAGGAICRRAGRERDDLVPFCGLAVATAGGIIGLSQALALTVAYVTNYSTWPTDRFDQVLVVLSYPIFGSLGLVAGALVGLVVGAVAGGILRVVSPAR